MLGFEESFVLTSSDGLAYTSSTPLPPPPTTSPSDLLSRARREREEARKNLSLKSLREQLRENAERAEAEWKETHNPFMAPKGLDGEEVEWLGEEEGRRRDRERVRRLQEERDRVTFELAVARRKEEEAAQGVRDAPEPTTKGTAGAALPSFDEEAADDRRSAAAPPPSSSLLSSLTSPSPSFILDRLNVVRVKRKDHPTPPAPSPQPASPQRPAASLSPPGAARRPKLSKPSSPTTAAPPDSPSPAHSASLPSTSSAPSSLSPASTPAPATTPAPALSSLLAYGEDDDDDD